jgi:hypothetical protein
VQSFERKFDRGSPIKKTKLWVFSKSNLYYLLVNKTMVFNSFSVKSDRGSPMSFFESPSNKTMVYNSFSVKFDRGSPINLIMSYFPTTCTPLKFWFLRLREQSKNVLGEKIYQIWPWLTYQNKTNCDFFRNLISITC